MRCHALPSVHTFRQQLRIDTASRRAKPDCAMKTSLCWQILDYP